LLDNVIPFSSVILLGVVVAVEDRFGVRVTREQLTRVCADGSSLRKLAIMIEDLQDRCTKRGTSSGTTCLPEHSSGR
jgi:acyl carrier protein